MQIVMRQAVGVVEMNTPTGTFNSPVPLVSVILGETPIGKHAIFLAVVRHLHQQYKESTHEGI